MSTAFLAAIAADLSTFLADFGQTATWNATSITVIFDNKYATAMPDMGGVMSSEPQALCRSTDVAAAAVGDSFTVNSVTYTISRIEPDGTGLTVLRLRKV